VHKYPIKQLAKKTKLSPEEIRQDIESFEIMSTQFYEDYGQDKAFIHRFSYFKEFVKDKKLRNLMENLKLDSKDFCEWVGERKIEKAADVRKLRQVLETDKSREMFLKKDFDRAIEILKDLVPEKADKLYTQMQHLTEMLDEVSFQDATEVFSSDNPKRKIFLELQNKMCDISQKFSK
jgi:Mg/Co/Ni transporter MgtE